MPKGKYTHKPNQGFQKGHKFGVGKKYLLGRKHSEETKIKMSEAHEGEKAYQWKGDKVGYHALHKWVSKHLGKPQHCAYCQTTSKKYYHWANISHSYKRELSDWVRLCPKCHKAYDMGRITL